jgi:hypothetical protein
MEGGHGERRWPIRRYGAILLDGPGALDGRGVVRRRSDESGCGISVFLTYRQALDTVVEVGSEGRRGSLHFRRVGRAASHQLGSGRTGVWF